MNQGVSHRGSRDQRSYQRSWDLHPSVEEECEEKITKDERVAITVEGELIGPSEKDGGREKRGERVSLKGDKGLTLTSTGPDTRRVGTRVQTAQEIDLLEN